MVIVKTELTATESQYHFLWLLMSILIFSPILIVEAFSTELDPILCFFVNLRAGAVIFCGQKG